MKQKKVSINERVEEKLKNYKILSQGLQCKYSIADIIAFEQDLGDTKEEIFGCASLPSFLLAYRGQQCRGISRGFCRVWFLQHPCHSPVCLPGVLAAPPPGTTCAPFRALSLLTYILVVKGERISLSHEMGRDLLTLRTCLSSFSAQKCLCVEGELPLHFNASHFKRRFPPVTTNTVRQ